MRSLDVGFAAHIATSGTTLCNCWRLSKSNGEQLGFTDHDNQLEFDGTVFLPSAGLSPGTNVQQAKSNVDTSEIVGWIDDGRIVKAHIDDGQFAGARVEHFKVNWRDVSIRHHFRTDFIGEITEKDGVFVAELRSWHHLLNRSNGRLFQRQCNAAFGDAQCGVDATLPAYSADCTITALPSERSIAVEGIETRDVGWPNSGKLIWLEGVRKNKALRIVHHERKTGFDILHLSDSDHGLAEIGDPVRITVGCDKSFATCISKFSNHLNFRGYPHIPGENFVLKYPRSEDPMNGEPLIK